MNMSSFSRTDRKSADRILIKSKTEAGSPKFRFFAACFKTFVK
jgi:hypothetical protein